MSGAERVGELTLGNMEKTQRILSTLRCKRCIKDDNQLLDFSTANRAMQAKSLLRFDETKMNELNSMSVALTMMDHTKANVFENEVAKLEDFPTSVTLMCFKVKVRAIMPPLLLSYFYLFGQFKMFQSLVKRH